MWDVFNGRSLLIREPNEVRILRHVRDCGEISRIEISRACNLSKASVTDIVARLIDSGFLIETGKSVSSDKGGRRRILLKFQPLAGVVVGVDIRMSHATVAITDLNATLLVEEKISYAVGSGPEEVLPRIVAAMRRLLAQGEVRHSRLVGVGVGIPGLVDYTENTLMLADTMKGWKGAAIGRTIETEFEVPVYIENDVKTMTLGEYLFGAAKGISNLIHLWIGDGIGAGIILNGKLHRGITSSAGEIGYNELGFSLRDRSRFPLLYDDQADFGDILSDNNVVERYRRAVGRPADRELTMGTILDDFNGGEETARKILDEYSSLVSAVCINLINILNTELIVLNGTIAMRSPSFIDIVQKKIRTDILSAPAETVRIKPAVLGERGTVLGAVGLVLYELFEPLHSHSIRPNTVPMQLN
jgi:N-acetylglucosamine repressor